MIKVFFFFKEKFWQFSCINLKSSCQRCSIKKTVLKNFAIFTGKHHVLESLFNKIPGLQVYKCIRKRLRHRCFHVNISEFLRTPILKDICERLLLNFVDSVELITESWTNNRKNRDACGKVFIDGNQRRIQNTLKHLIWSFLQK